MKIGVFTDSHCSDKKITCTTRRPSLSLGKIKEAMEYFTAQKADAVLCMGDLTDYCENRKDDLPMLEKTVSLIASYSLPFYCMRGNHDADAFTKQEFYSVNGIKEPPFTLSGDRSTAVFLDACYDRDENEYAKGKVDWENTCVPCFQIEALTEILSNPDLDDITVFIHQNISDVPHPSHIVSNAEEIRKMLSAYSGKIRVFEGHFHPGYSTEIDGVPYTVLKAMCEGEENSYTIIEI